VSLGNLQEPRPARLRMPTFRFVGAALSTIVEHQRHARESACAAVPWCVRCDQRLQDRFAAVRWGMSSQSALPRFIRVRVTRTPLGVWVGSSSDLEGLFVASTHERALRESIGEQITTLCRARGFEVDVTRANYVEDVSHWSIVIVNRTQASGPSKIETEYQADTPVSHTQSRQGLSTRVRRDQDQND
jgi:hypothetical protein